MLQEQVGLFRVGGALALGHGHLGVGAAGRVDKLHRLLILEMRVVGVQVRVPHRLVGLQFAPVKLPVRELHDLVVHPVLGLEHHRHVLLPLHAFLK